MSTSPSTLSQELAPAFYFPVSPKPLVMEAGFSNLGTDFGFGNGAREGLFFQRDRERERYRQTKEAVARERAWADVGGEEQLALHKLALAWLAKTQARELGEALSTQAQLTLERLHALADLQAWAEWGAEGAQALHDLYHELALNAQEDLALLALSTHTSSKSQDERPSSSLIMGHVTMPSFWAPERIRGASFYEIHLPVPGFPRDERVAERLSAHIASRGPLVRFVWTVANDDRLDHHPQGGREGWREGQPLWFRVERQLTVPLEGLGALFLIRTYLYPFEQLTPEQRDTLREALEVMPEEIARYKGLWAGREVIIKALSPTP
jgi:hypothetical protein